MRSSSAFQTSGGSRTPTLALLAALCSFAGLAMLAISGPGYRMGWWGLQVGLQSMLRYAAYAGIAGALLGLVALVARRGVVLPGLALVLGIITAGIPWQWQRAAAQVPRIHDITTDTATPPQFDAIVPVREAVKANSLEISPEVIEQQRQGYPDIGPITLPVPPAQAFERALALARSRGWEIVAADASAGHIEATDTTRWFGFKDDIVIRITPQGDASRVDLRSVSRVGRSDVGTNARRIREFVADLQRAQ
jgi:uncharacterized protein (DUF1499 family)